MNNSRKILTFLIGFSVITGVTLVDKLLLKGFIFALAFLAYYLTGILYSFKIIQGKKDGGQTQDLFFVILLMIFWWILYAIFNYIKKFIAWWQAIPNSTWYLILWFSLAIVAIFIIIIIVSNIVSNKRKSCDIYKNTYVAKIDISLPTNGDIKEEILQSEGIGDIKYSEKNEEIINLNNEEKLYILKQLWDMNEQSPIRAKNVFNNNIEWVEIYKDPYKYKKVYGKLKLKHWKYGYSGYEIFDSEKKVWKLI